MLKVIIGIAVGVALGALMGHFGKCSSGGCPLTANPYRGAIYGGVMGALFAFSFAGSSQSVKADAGGAAAESAAIVHVNSNADFEKYVVNATMPCLADFYSDRCGPCRRLAPVIAELADKYDGRAVICKVSLDAAPGLSAPHGIRGIPAVLFFDGGKEVARVVGLRSQSSYEKILDGMVAKLQTVPQENKTEGVKND
jgi:thioredoxin 1